MRWTRRSNRKALKVLALAFAASASFAGNATAAQVHDGGSNVPSFEPILSVAQQYGGTAELPAAVTSVGVSSPDGYQPQLVASVREVSNPDGYQPQLRGTEQLLIRGTPDGYQPQTTDAGVVSISANSSRFEADDLALGFGLGLILATAGAIALAMSRDRGRMAHS
jgi:hypothetical protein